MVAGALANKYASRQASDTRRRPLNRMDFALYVDSSDYPTCIDYRPIRQSNSSPLPWKRAEPTAPHGMGHHTLFLGVTSLRLGD
jgi:hypothetical protein